MKSLFLAVSLAILASCAPAFAGPILQDWCFVGTNTCTSPYNHYITATGTYTLNQQDALKPFPVNLTRIGATDTITAYLADANGAAISDVMTIQTGSSGYVTGGGVKRYWLLPGKWRLVVTKCVGRLIATVEQ